MREKETEKMSLFLRFFSFFSWPADCTSRHSHFALFASRSVLKIYKKREPKEGSKEWGEKAA